MTASPNPGERWIARLRPVGSTQPTAQEATVTLIDFDARTDVWTVRLDGGQESLALAAADLIGRAD
jgi:cation diffusion facilitator CzcD-associated flavoprotein CzcO